MSSYTYVVRTDLPPEMVTELGVEIFVMWVNFALGIEALGGRKLVHPSGKYASSIQFKQTGESEVAIVAGATDDEAATVADVIEQGHGPVDLKARLGAGVYPMHRLRGHKLPSGLRRSATGRASLNPTMRAEMRAANFEGFASIGPNSDPNSWIIPAMQAYSPAFLLAQIAQRMARDY